MVVRKGGGWNGTGSGSCTVVGFGISSVAGPLCSATRELVDL
jgi:hypothetical protein